MPSSTDPRIDAWMAPLPPWQQAICVNLRSLAHQADPEIAETMKWNAPYFTLAGNVCGFFAATDWVHVFLPNGALVADPHGIINGGLDNKLGRSILIRRDHDLNNAAFVDIIRQIIASNRAGKRVKLTPEPKHELVLSPEIRHALHNAGLQQTFDDRPYYQRKHWPEWIEAAKKPETRQRRLESMLAELNAGEYMGTKGNWTDGNGGRRNA